MCVECTGAGGRPGQSRRTTFKWYGSQCKTSYNFSGLVNNNFPNFCFHQQRSVALKYAKNALAAGDSAPDPAGGAHDAPPNPLVGWRGNTPSPDPTLSTPSAPRSSRIRRSLLGAFGASIVAPAALVFQLEPYHAYG